MNLVLTTPVKPMPWLIGQIKTETSFEILRLFALRTCNFRNLMWIDETVHSDGQMWVKFLGHLLYQLTIPDATMKTFG